MENEELTSMELTHFWMQFKNARNSGDFPEVIIFHEVLRSFAKWHEEKLAEKQGA